MAFNEAVNFALSKFNENIFLKDKQRETLASLYEGLDTISVLPTGYGKSLIYQLLPYMLKNESMAQKIAIIVSPLNAIMVDQVHKLALSSLKACFLSYDGKGASTRTQNGSKEVSLDLLKEGDFHLVYSHPETLQTPEIMKILRSRVYKENVCAVVIDEVHTVIEWGAKFRPAFQKLGRLTCLFPDAAHLSLTATASPARLTEISSDLQYREVRCISVNPDRPNIFIEIQQLPPNINKFVKYDSLIEPIAQELTSSTLDFPVTIIYMENLEALGYCYQFLNAALGERQYIGDSHPENRIFAQYHQGYTLAMKTFIVQELSEINPKIRLVLATAALGMGLHAPAVTRVIHSRPPTTIEAYMQGIGRAGRQGQQSSALLLYNNSDLAPSRKGLTKDVIEFCRNQTSCLRKQLLAYFGFHEVLYSGDPKQCCSNCRYLN